ncbi:MAG: GntR family transcriptional regulator, partial [Muribaculaceae bacterium]|nr:GntR family transcriptional regulator [Muribaculaceae bacterium]
VNIGQYNRLTVVKRVDFGVYLDGGNGVEILLPEKYVESSVNIGDEVDVFIYTDSEDRLIATTERPYAKVGEFAFLQVSQVNEIGAFLDWGISGKDLLVPFSEQKSRMLRGGIYPVYVYLDVATKRVAASTKIDKFLGNKIPRYKRGDNVRALVLRHEDPGYRVIVDNLFKGIIYDSDVYEAIEVGETIDAHVRQVRPDGKIDLSPGPDAASRVKVLAEKIYYLADAANGTMPLSDSSTPEEIKSVLQCSKKDFKKAVGFLMKNGLVSQADGRLTLTGTWSEKIAK